MDRWAISKSANLCREALEATGLTINVVQDIAEIVKTLEGMGRAASPMLDPKRNVFTKTNCLWVFALLDGEPVITCGSRVDDLGDESLGAFIARAAPMVFGVQLAEMLDDSALRQMTGRAVYLGDLKANTNIMGTRPIGEISVIDLFSAYAQHVVFETFSADFSYCFLRSRDSRRHTQYCFLDCEPFPFITAPPMYSDANPGWVATLPKGKVGSSIARVVRQRGKFLSKISTSARGQSASLRERKTASNEY